MHSHHAGIKLIGSVISPLAHQTVRNGSLDLFGKCPQLIRSIGNHCAAAYKDKRLLGLADNLHCPIHRLLGNLIRKPLHRRRRFIGVRILRRRHILGNIHQHRTRTPCLGNGKGSADHLRQLCYIFNNKIILRNRHGHARNINFLEAVLSQKAGAHIAGNCNHWNRVHICRGNPRNQIRCPRPRSRQTHAHLPRSPGIPVRRVRSPLLMRGQNMPDFLLVLIQCIINI